MINKKIILSVAIISLVGCFKTNAKNERKEEKIISDIPPARPGEFLIEISDLKVLEDLKNEFSFETVDQESGVYLAKQKSEKIDGMTVLQKNSGIQSIEPNLIFTLNEVPIPRDPEWFKLWGLKNYGQDAPSGVSGIEGADIEALNAWEISTGSKEIVVAVVDTGIDYTHPDLQKNIFVNEKELHGIPGVDEDGNGFVDDIRGWDFVSYGREKKYYDQLGDNDGMDDHGHGTHVSGTIGAVGNNGVGIVGINWKVRLMPIKILDVNGSGSLADIYRGVLYAAMMKADVINASFGGGGESKLFKSAIKKFIDAGGIFVAAAGNDAANNDVSPHYPSNYDLDGIVAVAATDNRDKLAEFSCYGQNTVDIAAPGVAILSTYPVAMDKQENEEGYPYRAWSGTSMATPHVAGAAALMLAANPDLRKNPLLLKARLLASAEWSSHISGKTLSGGRLNIGKSLKGAFDNTINLDHDKWVEEDVNISTPRYTIEKINHVWKITKPGAKAIRFHIKSSVLDDGFDRAMIYDKDLTAVMEVSAFDENYWSPSVVGDVMYLKFSNAIVNVEKYLGTKIVTDPTTEIPPEQSYFCFGRDDGKYDCDIHDKPTAPFPNFDSEGIVIDKISYLPADKDGV